MGGVYVVNNILMSYIYRKKRWLKFFIGRGKSLSLSGWYNMI